ncbi:MAG: PEP-CTERM sorting domain-containing protein [Phycisphaeraceae bacterium]|nr:PEP-CTERM sorting domain-containing protein [Phycisphaeraceae bacterium]
MNVSRITTKQLLATGTLSAILLAAIGTSANAATLVSSALDNSQTDLTGTGGIFSGTPGGDASAAVGGVTTTVVTTSEGLTGKLGTGSLGPQTQTLRAVSAANGMDLTYDVTYSPFRYDATNGDLATSTRRGGYVAVSSENDNTEREQTTANADGIEFWRVTIGNVVNNGATAFNLDGAVQLNFLNLSGIEVYDTYVGGVTGNLLGAGGTGSAVSGDAAFALSSPASSFAIVATADTEDNNPNNPNNFENRWEGIAVQFTEVPEPGSLALLGLGGLFVGARRRRK